MAEITENYFKQKHDISSFKKIMKTFGFDGVVENNKNALIDETFSDLLIHTPQIPIQTVSQIDQIQLCSQNPGNNNSPPYYSVQLTPSPQNPVQPIHFFQTILSLANKSRNKHE